MKMHRALIGGSRTKDRMVMWKRVRLQEKSLSTSTQDHWMKRVAEESQEKHHRKMQRKQEKQKSSVSSGNPLQPASGKRILWASKMVMLPRWCESARNKNSTGLTLWRKCSHLRDEKRVATRAQWIMATRIARKTTKTRIQKRWKIGGCHREPVTQQRKLGKLVEPRSWTPKKPWDFQKGICNFRW